MHNNFYHWHARAELKPDTAVLEPRWKAAVKFLAKPSGDDLCALLRLALFPVEDVAFCKRFSDALVKAEPTFPPNKNGGLLRVMATAALYSQMDDGSNAGDLVALGIRSADFPQGNIEPVTPDFVIRAGDYLREEAERVRPESFTQTLNKVEKKIEDECKEVDAAYVSGDQAEIQGATTSLARNLLAGVKESHQLLNNGIDRMAEESQFLWWLIGRRSATADLPRAKIAASAYALSSALEAASRVRFLPPSPCVESLLDEVLQQCIPDKPASLQLLDLLNGADPKTVETADNKAAAPELTPINSLLVARRTSGALTPEALKKLRIPPRTKVSASDLARQYFRERMFLNAIEFIS